MLTGDAISVYDPRKLGFLISDDCQREVTLSVEAGFEQKRSVNDYAVKALLAADTVDLASYLIQYVLVRDAVQDFKIFL